MLFCQKVRRAGKGNTLNEAAAAGGILKFIKISSVNNINNNPRTESTDDSKRK
jgi:hypothetical protein